ncbi:MAG: polysaccharide pyruvyl transferase family protein [Paludibacter sp.]|nr:polysaccharide pyruvyl transferase family protein [Paludibacter sp.]
MNYLYYDNINNFGDDLNTWLWPKIFKRDKIANCNNTPYFLGIGSILNKPFVERHNLTSNVKKYIFGAGVSGFNANIYEIMDTTWDIRFLRGPLSSIVLGNKHKYITDAAYAIRQINIFEEIKNTKKKYKVSIMPHFKSVRYIDWQSICSELGFHYISPIVKSDDVEFILSEISASEMLITEAMHGAILADIFRVPWHRFVYDIYRTDGAEYTEFKWNDWLYSIGMHKYDFIKFPYKKQRISNVIKMYTKGLVAIELWYCSKKQIIKKFKNIDNHNYFLSESSILQSIDERIEEQIFLLNQEVIHTSL